MVNVEDHINAVVATAGVFIITEFIIIIIEDHTMVSIENHIIAVVAMVNIENYIIAVVATAVVNITTGTPPEWMKMVSP